MTNNAKGNCVYWGYVLVFLVNINKPHTRIWLILAIYIYVTVYIVNCHEEIVRKNIKWYCHHLLKLEPMIKVFLQPSDWLLLFCLAATKKNRLTHVTLFINNNT